MCMRRLAGSVLALGGLALGTFETRAQGDAELIRGLVAVGPEGSGNAAAAKAWKGLAARDATALLPILEALDSANEFAANWLRSALETIVSRELAAGRTLPVDALEKFLLDTSHLPPGRRLSFELIAKVDSGRAERLLAGMQNDPGSELRREAVGRELAKASQLLGEARAVYAGLLTKARDVDQVDDIAKTLRKLGETVDIARAFGFVTEWKVIGPFDSVGGKGFDMAYPPELGIDLAAEHDGKTGKIRWQEFVSKSDYGDVNMNLPYTKLKGAAAYAFAEFHSEKARPVELRLGSENAFKVWLNGKFLFGQNEYHRLKEIDQYPMRAELRAGRNEILVKVCQNEQTEDWAEGWDFQLRICDPLGAAILSQKAGAK